MTRKKIAVRAIRLLLALPIVEARARAIDAEEVLWNEHSDKAVCNGMRVFSWFFSSLDRSLGRAAPWLVGLLAAASFAGWLGPWSWWLDLFSHFRVQYVLAALVLAAFALWRRRPVIAAMAVLLLAANGAEIVRVGALASTAAAMAPGALKILSLNLWNRNRDTGRVLDYIRREDADVVILNEVVPHWARALDQLGDRYPYRFDRTDCREFRLCEATILSKRPWRAAGGSAGGVGRLPLAWAAFEVDGKVLTVAGTHMLYGLTSSSARKQRVQIDDLAAFVRAHPGPLVVAGDFNATPWSAVHDRLVGETGLAPVPVGWMPTWPAWPAFFSPLAIPIDHVFHGPGVSVVEVKTGPDVGSDHLPIVARVRVR